MSEEALPFTLHLEELRKRLFRASIFLGLAFVICFNYSDFFYAWLIKPLKESIQLSLQSPYFSFVAREKVHDLVFLAPAEAFWTHMKIAFIAALMIGAPIVFWQFWAFISPGLHKKEKRLAIPFVGVTSILFILGSAFCFIVVLPFAMNFLLNFRTESLVPMISVERYVDFCLKFIMAFGIIFELPVVIVFLSRFGIVSPEWLSKNRKYSILMAFVAAAFLTPTPDAFNQTLMAVPIIILYETGIIAARVFGRSRKVEDEDVEDTQDSTEGESVETASDDTKDDIK